MPGTGLPRIGCNFRTPGGEERRRSVSTVSADGTAHGEPRTGGTFRRALSGADRAVARGGAFGEVPWWRWFRGGSSRSRAGARWRRARGGRCLRQRRGEEVGVAGVGDGHASEVVEEGDEEAGFVLGGAGDDRDAGEAALQEGGPGVLGQDVIAENPAGEDGGNGQQILGGQGAQAVERRGRVGAPELSGHGGAEGVAFVG